MGPHPHLLSLKSLLTSSPDISIHLSQWIGAPLYWINRDYFYTYMALTKQSFGLLITSMTYWWGPTIVRISGDASVAGQIKQTPDGRVQFSFPARLVLIANHQASCGYRRGGRGTRADTGPTRSTPTGSTSGGWATPTNRRRMGTCTSS